MRGKSFIALKVTSGATRIAAGLQSVVRLDSLDARLDWEYVGGFVGAKWLMLQRDEPDDFVIATGEMHSVKEFLAAVFRRLEKNSQDYVEIDPQYFRPTELHELCGDSINARDLLG